MGGVDVSVSFLGTVPGVKRRVLTDLDAFGGKARQNVDLHGFGGRGLWLNPVDYRKQGIVKLSTCAEIKGRNIVSASCEAQA